MKLGIKIALAFFLLSVLPLAGISVYSYRASISVFRKAVEAESGVLAEEMGGRMATMRRDLSMRLGGLANFPFPQLMAVTGEKVDEKSNPLMAKLMAEIGDAAPLVNSIEFNAADPRTAPQAPLPKSSIPKKPQAAGENTKLRQLVIHLSDETSAPTVDKPSMPNALPEGYVMSMRPYRTGIPGRGRQLGDADKQRIESEIRKMREFQVVLEKMDPQPDRKSGGPREPSQAGPDTAPKAGTARAQASKSGAKDGGFPRTGPFTVNLSSEVRAEGHTIGTVNTRISTSQMFRNVLSTGRRRPGEIAFLIDSDNSLHTMHPADEKKLALLGLPDSIAGPDKQAAAPVLQDWVVVTRKDDNSKVTFGIARPVSEPLREIRNTAARNLGLGLAMVGLALLGIIPLAHGMTRNLAALARGAEQLAKGDLNARVEVTSRDEIGRLAESFNRMARDLKENQKHLVEKEQLRKELEMSRRIQEELLPKRSLHAGPVEIKGVSIPAREVGGDFFNYFPLPHGDVAILVGDVSGKGVAAALLMANLQATLQARLPLIPDLAELARQLDHEIHGSTPPEVYLTLFMSILTPGENRLRYVNAGHHTQFGLHANGDIDRLESTGRPLGLLPGGEYVERQIRLAEGDALFLYTDGLVDAENDAGQEFGNERLESVLLEARKKGVNEILARVEDANRRHRGAIESADDATMLILKISASAPARLESPI